MNKTVHVQPGDLILYRHMGIAVRAAFYEPEDEEGERPYVTIDTSDLPARFKYDEKTGLRGDASPYSLELTTEQPLAEWTITGPHGVAAVVRQMEDELDLFGIRRAQKIVNDLNEEWRESVGTPIISVHLNDSAEIYEIYDDAGQGNTAHLTEQVVEQLRRMKREADQESERIAFVPGTESEKQFASAAGYAEGLKAVLELLERKE